ncbi:MAG: flagellar protein FlaG [Desulfotomaculales bacterium]
MSIGSVGRQTCNLPQPDRVRQPAAEQSEQARQDAQKAKQARRAELQDAFDRLEKIAYIFDRRFHFKVHEETKRYYVQIIDQATGEVISEVPPEKILDLVAQIQKLVGLLIDKRA